MSVADAMLDFPVHLGWKPEHDDPRTLRMAAYTTDELPAPPRTRDWLHAVEHWDVLANDEIGDCEQAASAHLGQLWTALAGKPWTPTTDDVVRAYAEITGFDPATRANDNGTTSRQMLNYWRKVGIGGHKIAAYVKVDHRDPAQMRTAINLFEGVLVAADMPRDAAAQTRRRQTWNPTPGPGGARGSWGGHAFMIASYNARTVAAVTWGLVQKISWPWWTTYGAESYAVISEDHLDALGRTALGFDLDAMLTDLHRLTSSPRLKPGDSRG